MDGEKTTSSLECQDRRALPEEMFFQRVSNQVEILRSPFDAGIGVSLPKLHRHGQSSMFVWGLDQESFDTAWLFHAKRFRTDPLLRRSFVRSIKGAGGYLVGRQPFAGESIISPDGSRRSAFSSYRVSGFHSGNFSSCCLRAARARLSLERTVPIEIFKTSAMSS